MKNIDIWKAAKDYSRSMCEFKSLEKISRRFFYDGAKWYIESAWYNACETPEEGKILLCITSAGPLICGPNNREWEDMIKEFGITRWAYIDDLLPEEE